MIPVSVRKCKDYGTDSVDSAVRSLLDDLGGAGRFATEGQTVFVKPNLVMPLPKERAATTHPSLVYAVCKAFSLLGARVVVGDCPGYPLSDHFLKNTYKVTGIEEAALAAGAELNYDTDAVMVPVSGGRFAKSVLVLKPIAEADLVVNLPKLKTHGLTLYSGAVKNMFGVVPGLKKAEYHARMPRVMDFAGLLVDISLAKKPGLTIMDAVSCMEGSGPTHGTPVDAGLIMGSEDPFLLDIVASRAAGIDPSAIPTITAAHSRRIGPPPSAQIRLLGDPYEPVKLRLPPMSDRNTPLRKYLPDWAAEFLIELVRPVPYFDPGTCTGCSTCERHCPPQALRMNGKQPHLDLKKCIRCFCCQELCPRGAVQVRRPWLGRLVMRERI